jgi:hypothetical protein
MVEKLEPRMMRIIANGERTPRYNLPPVIESQAGLRVVFRTRHCFLFYCFVCAEKCIEERLANVSVR